MTQNTSDDKRMESLDSDDLQANQDSSPGNAERSRETTINDRFSNEEEDIVLDEVHEEAIVVREEGNDNGGQEQRNFMHTGQ